MFPPVCLPKLESSMSRMSHEIGDDLLQLRDVEVEKVVVVVEEVIRGEIFVYLMRRVFSSLACYSDAHILLELELVIYFDVAIFWAV